MKIAFIGAGNMSEAIISGILRKGVFKAPDITISDPLLERRNHMEVTYHVQVRDDNIDSVAEADVVILAVKPQVFPAIWDDLMQNVSNKLIISIMAGITSETIASGTDLRVIRVMPNTPSLVGRGASGIAKGFSSTEEDMKTAEKIMQSVGISVRVEENLLHAVTALSGSGPAYVFYFMEAMIKKAIDLGLDEDSARLLCVETVGGAADLLASSNSTPLELRDRVTSKGGTTAAALEKLEENEFLSIIAEAMESAFKRSEDLS